MTDDFGNISGRVDDCVDGILDIKELMSDMNMSTGNSSSENAKKIQDLKKYVDEHMSSLKKNLAAKQESKSSNQNAEPICVIGGFYPTERKIV